MKKRSHSKLHTLKNTGFTLVELVVSMTLTAIFATAIVAIMPAATRIYMQIQNMSRAQIVADMVVDALREECANTYIEDYASVRIVNVTPPDDGDSVLVSKTMENEAKSPSASAGNVLIIRKSGGYCEAIYSCMSISYQYLDEIEKSDKPLPIKPGETDGISSRAYYRLFDSNGNPTLETNKGYIHYGYYKCGRVENKTALDNNGASHVVSCIFPANRYDYTNPFPASAYNGYTVNLVFSDFDTSTDNNHLYDQRPLSVKVTVEVYKGNNQDSDHLIYTRNAILVFAEDTTK